MSETTHQKRVSGLHRRRDLKMAQDAHAYVRGSTERFYEWLATGAGKSIPEGPRMWICGDAHVGNLGPIARCNEQIEIELRDLDQSVPGNPAHDLIRLALSLAMAARSSDLPGVTTARLLEELMSGYLEALEWVDVVPKQSASAAVRFVVAEAMRRKWRHIRQEAAAHRQFRLGKRFLALDAEERQAVDTFLDRERVRQLVTKIECRRGDAEIRIVDAAFWVKGCSSLGLWRCAALVQVGKGKGRGAYSLLDIKEAVSPYAPVVDADAVPKHHGERVVAGARALAPALGDRMLAGTVLGHEVFVRELMPQDLKVELEMLDDLEARYTARALARVVGRAHARQLDPAQRADWKRSLEDAATKNLDAPGWLWSTVVDLIGVHERAYLEHCRRYALGVEKARQPSLPDQPHID